MRARKKNWTEKEIEINQLLIKNPEDFKGKWNEYFGNSNPIHIEIGCGKGRFINESAKQNPNVNYIGIEREIQVIVSGMRAAREADVNNIGFCIFDAVGLDNIFSEKEIKRIYINFCDPWHRRKKWAKRRLTHRNFLNIYKKLLDCNSEIHFKTDNRILFEFSLNEFADMDWKMKNISLNLHNSGTENIMTEYEEKFSEMGMPIYRLEAYWAHENK